MTHDYKNVIDRLNRISGMTFEDKPHAENEYGSCLADNFDTIIRALRIADRLMGEPSDSELNALNGFAVTDYLKPVAINNFKRYRNKILQEVTNENPTTP